MLISQVDLPAPIIKYLFKAMPTKELRNLINLCLIKRYYAEEGEYYSIEPNARIIWPSHLFPNRRNYRGLYSRLSLWLAESILTYIAKESGDTDWSPAKILKIYSQLHQSAMWAIRIYLKRDINPLICEYIVKAAHNASFTGYSRDCIDNYLLPLLEKRSNLDLQSKLSVLRQLMWDYYLVENREKAQGISKQLLVLTRGQPKYYLYKADALRILGMVANQLKNSDAAHKYFDAALSLLEDKKTDRDLQLKAALYEIYANLELGYSAKIDRYKSALTIAKMLPNSDPFCSLLYQKCARTLLENNILEKVLKYLDASLERSVGRLRGKAYDNYYRALYYEKLGDIKNALEQITQAHKHFVFLYSKRAYEDYIRITQLASQTLAVESSSSSSQ